MDQLITLKEGSQIIGFQDWQTKVETEGEGKSYGVELFLQKKKEKQLDGSVTPGLGFAKVRECKSRKWYPYKFDRRHDFSLVLSHQFNEKVDLGLTWVYGTGSNITMMDARYPEIGFNSMNALHDASSEIQYYSSRNNYHASKPTIDWTFVLISEKEKWGERTWSIGAYNAYNRKNPYYIYFQDQTNFNSDGSYTTERVAKQVSLFPIIPSVSYHFKFLSNHEKRSTTSYFTCFYQSVATIYPLPLT